MNRCTIHDKPTPCRMCADERARRKPINGATLWNLSERIEDAGTAFRPSDDMDVAVLVHVLRYAAERGFSAVYNAPKAS